jgi:protein-S-isoprenylcysteine O-methyltransferase Ste14
MQRSVRLTQAADILEKFLLLAVFSLISFNLCAKLYATLTSVQWYAGVVSVWVPFSISVFVLSYGLIIILLIFRRPAIHISTNFFDWATSFLALFLPIALHGNGAPFSILWGTIFLQVGASITLFSVLHLWRSFGIVAADRGIQTGGIYRMVRHPLYAGLIISQIGLLFFMPSISNVLLCFALWVLTVYRIFAEEQLLKLNPQYQLYMQRTPYKLLPGMW